MRVTQKRWLCSRGASFHTCCGGAGGRGGEAAGADPTSDMGTPEGMGHPRWKERCGPSKHRPLSRPKRGLPKPGSLTPGSPPCHINNFLFPDGEWRNGEVHQVPRAGSVPGWDWPRGSTRTPFCPAKLPLSKYVLLSSVGAPPNPPTANASMHPKKYYQEFILFVCCQNSEALQVTLSI